MSEHLPSLLATERQAALFFLPPSYQQRLETEGQYTAERLHAREPDKYATIASLLAQGRGIRAIKRACHVHHDTIRAVAQRERIAIDTLKQRVISDLEVAIQVGAERAVDVMEEMKPEAMLVGLGILIDKYQLLTGGATVRVETGEAERKQVPTFDEWIAGLKCTNNTGLGEGGKVQMGVARESLGVATHAGSEVVTDCKSLAAQSGDGAATGDATGEPAGDLVGGDVVPEVSRKLAGAGGVETTSPPLVLTTGSEPGNFLGNGASPSAHAS